MNLEQKDRIGPYLRPHLGQFIFDELSENYLKRAGMTDILSDVPIPLRKTELSNITTLTIARNMAFVIGVDPAFQYRDNYIAYILRAFDKRFAEGLIADGVEWASKNDFDYACIQFRAAMQIDPENANAYYCYGRACKDAMSSVRRRNSSDALRRKLWKPLKSRRSRIRSWRRHTIFWATPMSIWDSISRQS